MKKKVEAIVKKVGFGFFRASFFISATFLWFLPWGLEAAGWKPEVGIPTMSGKDANFYTYVEAIYNFAAMMVGIVGVLMFLVGGFQYMVSAGNRGMAGEARKTMINALVGILLVLFAWVLLNTINSDLTNPSQQIIK